MVVAVPDVQQRLGPSLGVIGRPTSKSEKNPIVGIARRLTRKIADAADADQWAIALVGVPHLGAPDFEELVPRGWLELLNGHRPARYRITLVLQAHGNDLGIVRLGTIRPSGFSDLEIARARHAAHDAADELAAAMELQIPQTIA
jgi:hypothetical protein